jgi:hypothetical protein
MTFPEIFRFACLVGDCATTFDFFFNILVAEGNLKKQLLYSVIRNVPLLREFMHKPSTESVNIHLRCILEIYR